MNFVPYIQSSGTQWINPEVLVTASNMGKLRVVADIEITIIPGGWAVSGIGGVFPYVYLGVSDQGKIAVGRGTIDQRTETAYVQGRHTWDYDLANQTITVEGLLGATAIALDTNGTASQYFYISAYNTGSAAVCHKEKIWSYQFYLDEVLIRDLWPCYDPDGVLCLYDKVEKKYHYNAGTGEFTTGEGGSEEPSQITFTYNGNAYTADNGMTWAQWLASSYKTGTQFYGSGGYVLYGMSGYVKYGSNNVLITDVIVANGVYTK